MFDSTRILAIFRRYLLSLALGLSILAGNRPAWAAPETPAQARLHHDQAKVRAMSCSVVEFMLRVDDQTAYVGTGVYVEHNGKLFLLTADHVVTVDGQLPEDLGHKLMFRPYNADPDEAAEWRSVGQYATQVKRVPGADFAALVLAKPIDGLVPARLADSPARAGDRVIAFGFAAADGHLLRGSVAGTGNEGSTFVALKLGADHGDSGGPVFATNGKLLGLVSSNADPNMTEKFVVQHVEGSHNQSTWDRDANALGADTIAVHLPELLRR